MFYLFYNANIVVEYSFYQSIGITGLSVTNTPNVHDTNNEHNTTTRCFLTTGFFIFGSMRVDLCYTTNVYPVY